MKAPLTLLPDHVQTLDVHPEDSPEVGRDLRALGKADVASLAAVRLDHRNEAAPLGELRISGAVVRDHSMS
jgi:hypothetical protein